jgi:hypothetical protein
VGIIRGEGLKQDSGNDREEMGIDDKDLWEIEFQDLETDWKPGCESKDLKMGRWCKVD